MNHSQEWKRQKKIFEEKNGLSLLTGRRKPNIPHVDLREGFKQIDVSQVDFFGIRRDSGSTMIIQNLCSREVVTVIVKVEVDHSDFPCVGGSSGRFVVLNVRRSC